MSGKHQSDRLYERCELMAEGPDMYEQKTGGPERSQLRMIKSSGYRKTKDHIDRFFED